VQTTTHIPSEKEAKMPGPFIFIATNRLKPGASEAERRRVPGLVDFIEEGEPRLLAFNEYLNADRTEVTVVQVHPDAASMEFHMGVVRERAASAYAETLDARRIASWRSEPAPPAHSSATSQIRGSDHPVQNRVRERFRSRRCAKSRRAGSQTGSKLGPQIGPRVNTPAKRSNALCRENVIGETGFEPATSRPPAGCATRLRHSPYVGVR
jgi:hypothetical protein